MPTYDFDASNPLDTSLVSVFPANERASRAAINSWAQREHALTGRHKLPSGTRIQRDALTDLLDGMWFLDTESGLLEKRGASTWEFSGGLWTPGMMVVTAYNPLTFPNGWLPCDGRSVSTTTYAALFAKIGSVFDTQGGASAPGAGLFRVPNLESLMVIGFHSGGDGDGDHGVLGEEVGQKSFVVEEENIEEFTETTGAASDDYSTLVGLAGNGGAPVNVGSTETNHTHDVAIGQVGAVPIDNRPKSIVLGWLVKT